MRNFARSWVLDLKERGMRVTVVNPGPVRTPGLGEPAEIAKRVAFLGSGASSVINGVELFVDGGMAQV